MGSTGAPGSETEDGTSGAGETVEPGSSGEASTGVEPLMPPKVHEARLTPDALEVEGPIAALALAQNADGVRMRVDGGDPVELEEAAPGEFVGELGVFTALSNGIHDVAFTAWAGTMETEPLVVQYEATLDPAGSEAFWDASGVLGAGIARAVAVDQVEDWVHELGDLEAAGERHCYVRRRGPSGEYIDADLVEVLPGQNCTATAITIAEDGTLHMLVEATINGAPVWWLGRKDSWDSPTLTLAWGGPGEKGYALAQHPGRAEVAVCGTMPTVDDDAVDGMVAIFRKDAPGFMAPAFDYQSHKFDESVRDCAYDADLLVLVGEVHGEHPDSPKGVEFDRLLLIEYDTGSDAVEWTVAGPGPGLAVHSGARSLAITDAGTYLTFGFACESVCKPQLHLREFLPGGVPSGWNVLPAVAATFATDLVWSPAGHAILAAGKTKGQWATEFWLQGWIPGEETPAWSYSHLDQPKLQVPLRVATAKFGRIYAVGMSEEGDIVVPALAIVNP